MGTEGYDMVCFIASIIQGLHTGGTDAVICVEITEFQLDGEPPHKDSRGS